MLSNKLEHQLSWLGSSNCGDESNDNSCSTDHSRATTITAS